MPKRCKSVQMFKCLDGKNNIGVPKMQNNFRLAFHYWEREKERERERGEGGQKGG